MHCGGPLRTRRYRNAAPMRLPLTYSCAPQNSVLIGVGVCRFNRVGARIKSEADMEEIMDNLQEQALEDKKMRSYAVIPPILLDARQRKVTYMNNNGHVVDMEAECKSRKYMNVWTDGEKEVFKEKYLQHPKNFGVVASYLDQKSVQDCVQHYYLTKKTENYKQLLRKSRQRTRSSRNNPQKVNSTANTSVVDILTTGVTTRLQREQQQKTVVVQQQQQQQREQEPSSAPNSVPLSSSSGANTLTTIINVTSTSSSGSSGVGGGLALSATATSSAGAVGVSRECAGAVTNSSASSGLSASGEGEKTSSTLAQGVAPASGVKSVVTSSNSIITSTAGSVISSVSGVNSSTSGGVLVVNSGGSNGGSGGGDSSATASAQSGGGGGANSGAAHALQTNTSSEHSDAVQENCLNR